MKKYGLRVMVFMLTRTPGISRALLLSIERSCGYYGSEMYVRAGALPL